MKLLMLGGVTPAHGIGDALLEYDGRSDDESARVIPQIDDPNPNNPDSNKRIVNDPNEDDLKQAKSPNPMTPNPNGNVASVGELSDHFRRHSEIMAGNVH